MSLASELINTLLLVLIARASIKALFAIGQVLRVGIDPPQADTLMSGRRIVIILKVYREEGNIGAAIGHIQSVLHNFEHFSAIIVGTAKERTDGGDNLTLDAARRAVLPGSPRIKIIEAPGDQHANVAQQLNYAVASIDSDPTRTWILTMDVDTRFSLKGIREINSYVNRDEKIIQQSGLFLANYSELSFWQKGHAILQSRWTICHEVLRIHAHRHCRLVLAHVVGHGLCINISTLRLHHGFPAETFIEDIHLGFNLAGDGEAIRSCYTFDDSDNPKTLLAGLRQEYSWSYGAMLYPLYWHHYPHYATLGDRRRIVPLIMMLQGIMLHVNWLCMSWVVVGLGVLAIRGSILALSVLGIYLIDYLACVILFVRLGKLRFSQIPQAMLATCTAILRRSLPADYALLRLLLGLHIGRFKTNH